MAEDINKLASIQDRAAAYLRLPYGRLVLPESDGTYRGEILEFPGCIATGDTPSEAYSALEDAACGWIESALARGQTIPEPIDANDFSGRMVLRIPRSLHKKASRMAERDRVSLNQFITVALAEYVGDRYRPVSFNFLFSTTQLSGRLSSLTFREVPASVANASNLGPWELLPSNMTTLTRIDLRSA